jgi:hypothetical protein
MFANKKTGEPRIESLTPRREAYLLSRVPDID